MGTDAITLTHVTKRYGALEVLRDCNKTFQKGRVHLMMGPSGAGKTTLLRLLMGLEAPDAGSIAGVDRADMAAVFQENRLLEDFTVSYNLHMVMRVQGTAPARRKGTGQPRHEAGLICAERHKETAAWREQIGSSDTAESIGHMLAAVGLADCGERPVRALSGGMKRRVALLRAVVADRRFLFFDEPLQGLDGATKERVMRFLLPHLAGRTVFWVTHDPAEAAYFPGAERHQFPW